MSGWTFALGRTAEHPLNMPAENRATSLALSGAEQWFAPGQPLVIGATDAGAPQWLGKITQVTTEGLSFTRPLSGARPAGALLWRPDSWLETSRIETLAEQHQLEPGVAVERSLGGEFFALELADPRETMRLALTGLTAKSEAALLNWLAAQAGWGLQPFTIISPSCELRAVRLSGEPIVRQELAGEHSLGGGNQGLVLPFIILGEGVWA